MELALRLALALAPSVSLVGLLNASASTGVVPRLGFAVKHGLPLFSQDVWCTHGLTRAPQPIVSRTFPGSLALVTAPRSGLSAHTLTCPGFPPPPMSPTCLTQLPWISLVRNRSAQRPWEPRIDNGFPSLVYSADMTPPYKLWYDSMTTGRANCSTSGCTADGCGGARVAACADGATLFAESDDGIAWRKPSLGVCPWPPGSSNVSNNIVKCPWHDKSSTGPIGIFIDTNPSAAAHATVSDGHPRRGQPVLTSFGMWGPGAKNPQERQCGWDGWVARSLDGIRWTNKTKVSCDNVLI